MPFRPPGECPPSLLNRPSAAAKGDTGCSTEPRRFRPRRGGDAGPRATRRFCCCCWAGPPRCCCWCDPWSWGWACSPGTWLVSKTLRCWSPTKTWLRLLPALPPPPPSAWGPPPHAPWLGSTARPCMLRGGLGFASCCCCCGRRWSAACGAQCSWPGRGGGPGAIPSCWAGRVRPTVECGCA